MLLIPAIDLKNGQCVRLKQGRMDDDTVYSDDRIATAAKWVEAGARRRLLGAARGAAPRGGLGVWVGVWGGAGVGGWGEALRAGGQANTSAGRNTWPRSTKQQKPRLQSSLPL